MTSNKRLVYLATLPVMVVGLVQLILSLVWWRDWNDISLGAMVLVFGGVTCWGTVAEIRMVGRRWVAPRYFTLYIWLAVVILLIVNHLGH